MAEKCPETCCQQWNVFFSRPDYLNLISSDCSERLKNIIGSAFIKINGNNNIDNIGESFNYAVIKLNEKGVCPLLDGDGLCLLQKELGEGRLGYVCSAFPRLKTQIGSDCYIYSCNMSCPKVAELLIAHREGLTLVTEKYDGEDRYLNAGIYSAPAVSESWEGFPFYWEIKKIQIQMLQDRSFTVPDRMLILGYFSQKANEYINHKAGANIISLAAALRDREMCVKIAESLKPNQSDTSFAVKSVSIFAKMLLSVQNKGGTRLKELFQTVADSIGLTFKEAENKKTDTSFNDEMYFKNLETYRKIEKERPYIMENILVNLIFTQPLNQGIWKNYFITALFYNMLKTCIPAFISAFLQGNPQPSDSDLALAVSRAAKMTVNNELITKDALLDFVDNRSYTLPHAAFLVG